MKLYTNEDLREKKACYDPSRHFEEDMGYTLLDYLNHDTCPAKDKIWCVTRFLDDRSNRLFAVWCAQEALKSVKNPDSKSLRAIEVSERFANGEATVTELKEAAAATYATYAADAATYATYAADAAYYAADAADDAAYYAADAAADAAYYATYAAADAAYYAAEIKKQIEKLKQEIQEGNWKEK